MASFLAGQTRCSICKEIIHVDDEYVATPPIPLKSPDDKFWVFHEAFMHLACFSSHPLRHELYDYIRNFPGLDHSVYIFFVKYLEELLGNEEP